MAGEEVVAPVAAEATDVETPGTATNEESTAVETDSVNPDTAGEVVNVGVARVAVAQAKPKSKSAAPEPSPKLFVSQVPKTPTAVQELKALFSEAGEVVECFLLKGGPKNKMPGGPLS